MTYSNFYYIFYFKFVQLFIYNILAKVVEHLSCGTFVSLPAKQKLIVLVPFTGGHHMHDLTPPPGGHRHQPSSIHYRRSDEKQTSKAFSLFFFLGGGVNYWRWYAFCTIFSYGNDSQKFTWEGRIWWGVWESLSHT